MASPLIPAKQSAFAARVVSGAALCGFLVLTPTALLPAEPWKKDLVLYRHAGRYAAFPTLSQGERDQLWVSFAWNTSRSHYGKAAGSEVGHVALYSPDGAKTWLEKGRDPAYTSPPPQTSSLVLSDGTAINIGPAMHEVLPGEKKAEMMQRGIAVKDWPGGHISASYRVRMGRRMPSDSQSVQSYPALPFFASMGGFGFGVVLPGDVVLKPTYGLATLDAPTDRAWVLRSEDKGDTWKLVTMANDGVHGFNESDLLALPDGRVLAMIRAADGRNCATVYERGFLWQSESSDKGKTWSPPRMTDMWGYPATLLLLRNGDLLCSYGYRLPPYGIRACFSRDGGRTWDVKNEVILRADALSDGIGHGKGGTGDLGYPRSVELSDGTIFTVYYISLGDGVTHIAATRWSPDYRGPANLLRGADAVPKPRPPNLSLPPERILGEVGHRKFDYALMQSFVPTAPTIRTIAIRVARESADPGLVHTHGIYVALRKPEGDQWFTTMMATSKPLETAQVKVGGWNAFVFEKPVDVKPGETYVLTVYNRDFLGADGKNPTRLRPGFTGDHGWYLNTSAGLPDDYPNGSVGSAEMDDLAFKVYSEPGPLPGDPK